MLESKLSSRLVSRHDYLHRRRRRWSGTNSSEMYRYLLATSIPSFSLWRGIGRGTVCFLHGETRSGGRLSPKIAVKYIQDTEWTTLQKCKGQESSTVYRFRNNTSYQSQNNIMNVPKSISWPGSDQKRGTTGRLVHRGGSIKVLCAMSLASCAPRK